MGENKLDEIKTLLRSIILENEDSNILDDNSINGLKYEKNIVYFKK
mgnify:CR=1 FL=1